MQGTSPCQRQRPLLQRTLQIKELSTGPRDRPVECSLPQVEGYGRAPGCSASGACHRSKGQPAGVSPEVPGSEGDALVASDALPVPVALAAPGAAEPDGAGSPAELDPVVVVVAVAVALELELEPPPTAASRPAASSAAGAGSAPPADSVSVAGAA